METQTETEQNTVYHGVQISAQWLFLTMALTLTLSTGAFAATKYNYTKHNTLTFPGAHNISLEGISFQRHLAGTYHDANGQVASFHKVGKQETKLPIAGFEVGAGGINNNDEIVGTIFLEQTSLDPLAFKYAGGQVDIFEEFPLWPAEINTAGVEVGTFADPGDLYCYARHKDWFFRFQVDEAAGRWCGVLDINEASTAMAGWQVSADWATVEGWVWTQQEGFKSIIIPGAYATFVENLSSDGSIQGSYATDPNRTFPGFTPGPPEEGVRGFSMAPSGEITIIHVPGAKDTYVKGGNARGDVVGTYTVEDAQGNLHWYGFIGNRAPPPKVGVAT
jgi:hypothetical protein